MRLHESIKVSLNQLGHQALAKEVLINALGDFQAFTEVPASKHVLKSIITEGYAEKVLNMYLSGTDWQLPFQNTVHDFIQKHAYKDDLVSYVFSCIAYGMGWVDDVVEYIPATSNIGVPIPPNSVERPTVLHSSKLEVVFCYERNINLAILQESIAFAKKLSIKNVSASILSNLRVQLKSDPGYAGTWEASIDSLATLEGYEFVDIPIPLSANFLTQINGRVSGGIVLTIYNDDGVLFEHSFVVELDSYNYWNGLSVRPELLASFVISRHPAFSPIIHRASEILSSWTGASVFDEYQTRDQNKAKQQAAAIFDAIRERKIVLEAVTNDYSQKGGKVRLADEILSGGIASELDMALLYASCLESVGLHPLILFTERHVICGLWLVPDTFADAVNDDLSLITKRTPSGISEIVLTDVRSLCASFGSSFDEAAVSADSLVADIDSFLLFIDVKQARFSNIQPLRLRTNADGEIEIAGEADTNHSSSRPQTISIDIETPDQSKAEIGKQAIWERRLLDLGLRNNLLNTKIGRRALQLISVDINRVEDLLADGQELRIAPAPSGYQPTLGPDGLFLPPRENDPIQQQLQYELNHNRLRAYLEDDDLAKSLTDLYRSARTSLEENGTNTLYMAIGMLRWYETPVSTKARFAPILLLPIEIVRKSAPKGYVIRGREEDTVINITLLEKLRQDFKINVAGLNPLPLDQSGVDVPKVFNILKNSVKDQSRWNVEEMVVIGNFSFNKFLMWNDIHNNAGILRQNGIVRSLMDGQLSAEYATADSMTDAERPDLDKTLSVGDLALPLSADSSQIEAIAAAAAGKSFVLHGPPGTGKSQTITNIIANALYQGKKVLFVAEKMAALQVVQHRLESIGLAPFCLELHSSKSKKSSVMNQLKRTTEITKERGSQQFRTEAQRINKIRNELNDFVSAMHRKREIGLSVYDCMSRLGEPDSGAVSVRIPNGFIAGLDENTFHHYVESVKEYAAICEIMGDVPGHAYLGCGISKYTPSLKQDLSEKLHLLQALLELYRDNARVFLQLLHLPAVGSRTEMKSIVALTQKCGSELCKNLYTVGDIDEAFSCLETFKQKRYIYGDKVLRLLSSQTVLSGLFGSSDLDSQVARIREILRLFRRKVELKESLIEQCRSSIFDIDIENLEEEWKAVSLKWALPRRMGYNKLRKRLTPHTIGELPRDNVPDLLSRLVEYHQKEKAIVELNCYGKDFWGDLLHEDLFDVDRIERALCFHEALRKRLLRSTKDVELISAVEYELSECYEQGLSAVHDEDEIQLLLDSLGECYDAVIECSNTLSKQGIKPIDDSCLIEEIQMLRSELQGSEALRILGFSDLDSCDWMPSLEYIDDAQSILNAVSDLTQDKDERINVLRIISDWNGQGIAEEWNYDREKSLVSSVNAIDKVCEEIEQLLECSFAGFEEHFVAGLHDFCKRLLANIDGLNDIVQYNHRRDLIKKEGLSFIDDAVRSGHLPSDKIVDGFINGLYRSYIEHVIASDAVLSQFHSGLFEERIKTFRSLCDTFENLTRQELYVKLAASLPNFQMEASRGSEVGILQRNIRNGARNTSLRSLFDQIFDLLIRICPCMLMSPMSVAQYISASGPKFDLVIFDEASQMPTCEAVGAIARGNSIIVVGDPNQLPPTAFFSGNHFDEDNADVEDLDSILEDCLALSMPSMYLLWHYRSKHESLISFSNAQFYENKLLTFPTLDDIASRVTFHHINGFYDRSRSRQNRAEADAIITEIKKRLQTPAISTQSIGVVTFNSNQQSLIEDLLNEMFDKNPALEKLAMERDEPIFVKNLENVQGDERDVILFSVGFGPDKTGKISYNFGPLNREGGWRRLNVAVSRARCEMMVFSSLLPEQIDENRSSAEGVRSLKMFLSFAQKGCEMLAGCGNVKSNNSDGVASAIASALTDRGYQVKQNIGSSDYRINLAVIDPANSQKYILGVICDGYDYYHARTARDREVVRPKVLEQLGWKLIRIWALDWWDNPQKTLDSIISAIDAIQKGDWQDDDDAEPLPPGDSADEGNNIDQSVETGDGEYYEIAYTEAVLLSVQADADSILSNNYVNAIRYNVHELIEKEAPISKRRLCRKALQSLGITRVGERLSSYMDHFLAKEKLTSSSIDGDLFYWSEALLPEEYKTFRNRFDREPLDIAPEEVSNAICKILLDQGSQPEADLIRCTARAFGYGSVRDIVSQAINRGLQHALSTGKIVRTETKIRIQQ